MLAAPGRARPRPCHTTPLRRIPLTDPRSRRRHIGRHRGAAGQGVPHNKYRALHMMAWQHATFAECGMRMRGARGKQLICFVYILCDFFKIPHVFKFFRIFQILSNVVKMFKLSETFLNFNLLFFKFSFFVYIL